MKTSTQLVQLLLCVLLCFPLFGQLNFERDFATDPGRSYLGSWTTIGGKMYFVANDGFFGEELWQFDPNTEKAQRLTNLSKLSGGSFPTNMTEYNGNIYFVAWVETESQQIFRLNPQTLGLEQLTTSQNGFSEISHLRVYNDKLWFSAKTDVGRNLWSYSATANDFTLTSPPQNGSQSNFAPLYKFVHNDKLYINAYNSDNILELWSYDDATQEFTNIPTQFDDQQSIYVQSFSACGEELLLNLSGHWYHYDQAQDSCMLLVRNNSQTYRGVACIDDKFWYADPRNNDVSIYNPATRTNEKLKDLLPSIFFQPRSIKAIGDELYILHTSYQSNIIYRYTSSTNEMLMLFESENVTPQMGTLLNNDGDLFFFGKNIDTEIYKHENAKPIELIADINQSNGDGFSANPPNRFQVYNDRMYFNAYAAGNNTYWQNADVWSKSADPDDYVKFQDELGSDEEPYIFTNLVKIDGRMYFSGSVNGELRQLVSYKTGEDSLRWHGNVTYPATGITRLLQNLMVHDKHLLFAAFRDHYFNTQFFSFDTETETIALLPGLEAYVGAPVSVIGDKLIFVGSDSSDILGQNLISFDLLTQEVTTFLSDSTWSVGGKQLHRSGDKMLYSTRLPGVNKYGITLYDPATNQAVDVTPDGYSSIRPSAVFSRDGKTWFHSEYLDSTRIFTLDPLTGTCEEVFNFGPETTINGRMTWFDDKLFFYGEQTGSQVGQEVYFYDPATETIELYGDINIGPASSSVKSFFEFADRLYFVANDGHRGIELWSIGKCFSVSLETITDDTGREGSSIELTIKNGTAPYEFSWNTGATTQNLSGLSSGYYEVTITDANGCQATAFALLEGDILVSSSDDLAPLPLKVYPNPATHQLTIERDESAGKANVLIFDNVGRKMWEAKNISAKEVIDISQFANGLYVVLLVGEDNKMTTSKILVQH
ncbi:MAG: T9SS type A sorting domain-containing protein [Bacteroidota bacterium]